MTPEPYVHFGNETMPSGVPPPTARVHRTIVWPVGGSAAAIAERICALSHSAGGDLPVFQLQVLDDVQGGETEPAVAQMTLACDALSDRERMQRLRLRGVEVATPDELHVWLLLDLTNGERSGTEEEASLPEPAALIQAQAQLQAVTWQRLRAHLAWHVVLLLEPAEQRQLSVWSEALRGATDQQICVMSPVNEQHLRVPAMEMYERVAQCLAALLWSEAPSHALLERAATEEGVVAALAGVLWPSPAATICAWLTYTWAARALQTWRSDLTQMRAEAVVPNVSLDADLDVLRGRLPPADAAEVWQARRPSWQQLRPLPATLTSNAQRRAERASARTQQARLAWLDDAQTHWDAFLAELEANHLAQPSQPQFGPYAGALQSLRRQLDDRAARVDQRLEIIAAQLEEAEGKRSDAQQALQSLCDEFPACSVSAGAAALLQPWRWPGWLWSYLVRLPSAAQHVLDAAAEVRRHAREESTWHALRQHYLAAAQKTQARIVRLQQIESIIADTDALATARCAQLAAEVPAPWSEKRLEWLFQQAVTDADLQVAAFVAYNPPATWEKVPASEFLQRLASFFVPTEQTIRRWSALDWLAAAFAAREVREGAEHPAIWLDQMLQTAAPLWPAQELATGAPSESWLAMPDAQGRGEWLARALDLREQWLARYPNLLFNRSVLDALQVIRWSAVRIDLETGIWQSMEQEEMPDENAEVD